MLPKYPINKTTQDHTVLKMKAVITKFRRDVLSTRPYSPYPATSHFHLFEALKIGHPWEKVWR
jgi:hypothetical protein